MANGHDSMVTAGQRELNISNLFRHNAFELFEYYMLKHAAFGSV